MDKTEINNGVYWIYTVSQKTSPFYFSNNFVKN